MGYAVNAFSNGMMSITPIKKAHANLHQTEEIIDYDISPESESMAVLLKNSVVCIYDFVHSSNFTFLLLDWSKSLFNKSQHDAHRVLYFPYASQKLAVCSSSGTIFWAFAGHSWGVERIIDGNYSCMSFSPDGRLLALGSIYSAHISLYDLRTNELYTLPGIHSTVKDLVWSPTGRSLVAVSTEAEFRIYETERYTNERWSTLGAPANVAFMTADTTLFYSPFATNILYTFAKEHVNADFTLSPYIFDFAFHPYSNMTQHRSWTVHTMAISPKGRRLAAMYKRTEDTSELDKGIRRVICLFEVRGKVEEYTFVPMYGWSDGRGFLSNNKHVNPADVKFRMDRSSYKEVLVIKWENLKLSFFYCIN